MTRPQQRRVVLVANSDSRFVVADGAASFVGQEIVNQKGEGLGRFAFVARGKRLFACFGPALQAASRTAREHGVDVKNVSNVKPLPARGPLGIIGNPRVYVSPAEGAGHEVTVHPPLWGFQLDKIYMGAASERRAVEHGHRVVEALAGYATAEERRRDRLRALGRTERIKLTAGGAQ